MEKLPNGSNAFGFWENTPYGIVTDSLEECRKFKNSIPKKSVIQHIESMDFGISSTPMYDIFTGEEFRAGIYEDGPFTFPIDFLRYYKTQNIGIPYEYEDYLKSIGVGRVDL